MIRAIVIGVATYPNFRSTLLTTGDIPGATENALAFRDWLMNDRGIREEEISLHLSPAPASPRAKPATRAAIKVALNELRRSTLGGGDRFFFFSGHGFSFQRNLNGSLTDVLACEEFSSPTDMDPTIRIGSLLDYLRRMGPCDQYFFFDCCRNSAADGELEGGQLPLNEKPDLSLSDSSQFTLFAARPGETTSVSSSFTNAILAALRGTGSARVWSGRSLVVTFESLTQYVQKKMPSEPMPSRRGTSKGILSTLYTVGDAGLPPKEVCEIEVKNVGATERLIAHAYLEDTPVASEPLLGGQGTMRLTPRTYIVAVESPTGAYAVTPMSSLVDMFEPARVEAVATPRPRSQVPIAFPNGLECFPGNHFRDAQPNSVPLRVPSARVIARVPAGARADVIGADGQPRGEAIEGPDTLDFVLPAGHYHLRLWQAGRVVREVPVTLGPGLRVRADLTPAPLDPVRDTLMASVGGSQFLPSETLGPIHDPRLSLWLAAVAVKAASGRPHVPFEAREVPVPGHESGSLFIVIATGALPGARLWSSSGHTDIPMVEARGVARVYYGTCAGAPGSQTLGWETENGRFSMVLPLVANRVTAVVIVDSVGEPCSEHLFLVAHREREAELPRSERPTASQLLAARSLVNAEEAFAVGQPLGQFEGDWVDPLWTVLEACAAVREADVVRARAALDRLREHWPSLPDVPILERLLDDTTAPITGLPVVADNALALARWEDGEPPANPLSLAERALAQSLQRALPGTVWTKWAGWPGDRDRMD